MKSFKAQVDDWIVQSRAKMEAIVKQSAGDVIDDMQTPVAKGGNMPVDTGFLRNSLVVTEGGPSSAVKFNEAGTPGAAQPYELVIAGLELGGTLYGVYTANYAGFVHYGTNGRPGRLFVDLAAQKWPSIVAANAARLKSSTRI